MMANSTGISAALRGLAAAALLSLVTWSAGALAAPAQAPFGDKVSTAIFNYSRATPRIATTGRFAPAAVAEIQALGFTAILDLRAQTEKGVAAITEAIEASRLRHLSIPIVTKAPTEAQVAQFAVLVEDSANYPLLVNCASANRVGAIWALYRASKGVPAEVAVEEGRTLGLKPSREKAVRARLGLPPLS
jgi:uncharacterized protein (TIGR01244 family)